MVFCLPQTRFEILYLHNNIFELNENPLIHCADILQTVTNIEPDLMALGFRAIPKLARDVELSEFIVHFN